MWFTDSVVVFFIFVYVNNIEKVDSAVRFTKLGCNTSGLTVTNMICRYRSRSRTLQHLNMGGEVVKQVDNLFATAITFHRPPTGTSWRQILKVSDVNVCLLLNDESSFLPTTRELKDRFLTVLPFLPRKCPIMPGKYYGYNLTIGQGEGVPSPLAILSSQLMPNGEYRNIYTFSSKTDEKAHAKVSTSTMLILIPVCSH